jgi:hypothetical protein
VALDDISEGLTTRVWPQWALGIEDIPSDPDKPYIQYGFDAHVPFPVVRETGGAQRHLLRLFYYDYRGDYTRIDDIHHLIKPTIEGLVGQISPSGVRCTDAQFLTLGGDLTDNVRGLSVKQATFRLVAR